MRVLGARDLKELLNRCWMTHDGMWFYHCFLECGIEKANRINKAAIRSLAPIEVQRIRGAFGIEKIESSTDLRDFMTAARETVVADFMRFDFQFPSGNHLHVEALKCFAYEGIKRIGAIEGYECGIFERIEAWFDSLALPYQVSPEVRGCMMHSEGRCFRYYTFSL
jgi:hypothetical protein